MGNRIKITAKNFDECQGALEALRAHLKKLVQMIQEYPVECQFAEYRFVFTSEAEIDALIVVLDKKLVDFRSAA